jgi:hypothetical protein
VALRRYWVTFVWPKGPFGITDGEPRLTEGCGVTGYDQDDALGIIREAFGATRPIKHVVADVDISTLPDAVQTDLGMPAVRGVWYPAHNR